MTASPTPTDAVPGDVGLPSEETIARHLCRREGFDPDIKASHVGDALLWAEWLPDARAVLSLIRPAFEAKEREIERACADHANATIGWEHERGLREAAEAKLAQAVEALEPFADEKNGVMQDLLWGDEPDSATGTITTRLGHIRAARAVVREFRARSASARAIAAPGAAMEVS